MADALRRLPLHERHVLAGARFAPFAGWEMPLQYGGIVEEHGAVRGHAGIFDVSHMGRAEVRGAETGERVRSVTTADVTRLQPGRARYSLYCTEEGGIADDVMVYRIHQDRWLIVHNAANAEADTRRLRDAAGDAVADIGLDTVMLAVQGPGAAATLWRVLGVDLSSVPRRGCVEAEWEGSVVVFGRTGYTGEDGGEVIAGLEEGGRLWDAFVEDGVVPAGLGARDTLRLEAALPLHGHEITHETHPYEAGLGWAVQLDDGAPFTGRAALERLATMEPARRLACVRLHGRGVPREGYAVIDPGSGERAGTLTSGAFSPTLRTGIGMAYLPAAFAEPGTRLAVEIRGRGVDAEVVSRPFYQRTDGRT
jgi:aminomethyltransferase